ncbi:tonB-system energizer ExbB [Candidatus Nitrosacidococcus sp. I8]|uniref:tonB-system energizer ExbB n=1 Tax=Candidatus Nitrosacidococcus sp. I8 TaxID=2942908 RepID=UPI0022266997|nr:tonB-system energizer ExbB [Candidatus Nitrosacidococcus sp. I8]CAH9018074.1 Biopolymer transport protein ExbB [Candidatus Nitrosacidococcus sp. I8]
MPLKKHKWFFNIIFFLLAPNAWGESLSTEAAPLTPSAVVGVATLPYNLSPWGMFLDADIIVKIIIIGLIFASIATWGIWIAKILELNVAQRELQNILIKLEGTHALTKVIQLLHHAKGVPGLFAEAIEHEIYLSGDHSPLEGIKERISLRLDRLEVMVSRHMSKNIGILATIGATAPFVGLFGTVWGIMNSFIGISQSNTTNLAVVSPGIAEALLVTAIGLITAIPAVIIYNFFTRAIAHYRSLLTDISSEVLQLVSRSIDHQQSLEISKQQHYHRPL